MPVSVAVSLSPPRVFSELQVSPPHIYQGSQAPIYLPKPPLEPQVHHPKATQAVPHPLSTHIPSGRFESQTLSQLPKTPQVVASIQAPFVPLQPSHQLLARPSVELQAHYPSKYPSTPVLVPIPTDQVPPGTLPLSPPNIAVTQQTQPHNLSQTAATLLPLCSQNGHRSS